MTSPVVIVGGGFAGASAALRLSKQGISTLLLEARDRLGGRTYTQDIGGHAVDVGGSNIHGYQRADNPARQLAEELGIKCNVPQGKAPQVYFGGQALEQSEVESVQKRIDQVIDDKLAQVQSGQEDLPLESVVSSIRSMSPFAEGLARIPELPTGLKLEQISAKYYKTENAMVGVDALAEGGYSNMVQKAFEKAKTEIKLNTAVKAIEETSSGVKLTDANGSVYEAPAVICTIPLAVLQSGAVTFKPELPKERSTTLERTAVGTLDKLALAYESAWWPDNAAFMLLPASSSSSSPAPASSASPSEVLASTSILAVNIAANPGQKPVLLLLIGPGGAPLHKHSEADIAAAAHDLLSKTLASRGSASKPTAASYQCWSTDPYSMGATSAPIVSGRGAVPDDWTVLGESLWKGKLGFAGEHTDRHLRGSVPGAMASGYREADRVSQLLGKA